VTPRSPCDHRALDTLFAQKLRVAWAEDPKRRPVRGVEARRRLRLPRGVGHLQCEDELHVLGLAGGGLDGKVGVLVSVDEEETAAAPSNDREASRRRGASPADDRRELTAVQNRATGSRARAMNELVGKERWRRAWSDGVTRGRSHRRDRATRLRARPRDVAPPDPSSERDPRPTSSGHPGPRSSAYRPNSPGPPRSHGDRLRVEELEEKARGLLGSLLR
jgi:hypothetical protein